MSALSPVIRVIEEKCVNCHNCIAVCPVKWCIDGSGDKVTILHDLCIGCGSCIEGCSHQAREGIDDTQAFFDALETGEDVMAIVAPAMAARLGGDFLRLNGWLKSRGVKAVFDVAFGAELTVKSYEEHLKANKPATVIAQPCPAIVSYVQIYQPKLSEWLAPADSPMLHTIKMAREWRPDLASSRVAVISPCVAKRREFDETGLGDFNVTVEKLLKALEDRGIELSGFPEADFDNPPAETAVLFSSPGGLKATVERDFPGLGPAIRRIEGPRNVYPYFRELEESIKAGHQPKVVDCLNCEKGCNGGTGTGAAHIPVDDLEYAISARKSAQQSRIAGKAPNPRRAARSVRKSVEKFWKPGLYERGYEDRSASLRIKTPGEAEFHSIYMSMSKTKPEDFLNCAACGYNSCEMMAVAIHNGLNKPENCHHYQREAIVQHNERLRRTGVELDGEIGRTAELVSRLLEIIPRLEDRRRDQGERLEESAATITELLASLGKTAELSGRGKEELDLLENGVHDSEASLGESLEAIKTAARQVEGIHELVEEIDKIASQTNLLSMNAAIEAAHAGDSGRGFAVVAEEIRRLSEQVSESASKIGKTLGELAEGITRASALSDHADASVTRILSKVTVTAENLTEIYAALREMSSGTEKVNQALSALEDSAGGVKRVYEGMKGTIDEVGREIGQISRISRSNVEGS